MSGGEITIGTSLDPVCIDPHQTSSLQSLAVSGQLVDRLTDQDPDTGEIIPWLAESWETSADGSEFTFTLRDDVTFSDGTALNAQSVKDTFDSLVALGAKAPTASGQLTGYVESRVIDDSTVTIAFDAPNAPFLQATTTASLGIISSETASKTPEQRCADGIIGSGPFVFSSYTANESTVLVRRDGYAWGSAARQHEGEAYLDKVTVSVIPESGVRTGALSSGNVQLVDEVPDQSVATLEARGQQIISKSLPGLPVSAIFNMASPLAADEAVRQAFLLAVNREDIGTLTGSSGSPAYAYLTESTPGSLDLSEDLVEDPDAAADLLEDAGWVLGDDGIRTKDGVRLSLRLPFFFAPDVMELVQQQLAEVGIELELQELVFADYIGVMNSGEFDVTVTNWGTADASALNSLAGPRYRQSDPEFLALLDAQTQTTDPEARAAVTEDVQRTIFDKAYAVPMYYVNAVFAAAPALQGVTLDGSSRLMLFDAWVEE